MGAIEQSEFIIRHTLCLTRSFRKWTGRDLLSGSFSPLEFAAKLFDAPFVIVSHGLEPDPILNYGNRVAMELWEMTWDEFTRTPSRLTAEPAKREERAKVMEIVGRQGFFENYSGIRVSKSGKRFEISNATIWNLISETGELLGQAATFSEWKFL
ncbi:MAG TPA: MEKHLA domain-containing protein [Verrucomicrobiae bacterium]|nr:MEKHLA domain-containing protein [Verrucomicrobiae bacterium]